MTMDRDTLLDYVMGALTPEQEQQVAIFLNEHPEDAAWVRDMFETMADVALYQTPEDLAPESETALLERIRAARAESETPQVQNKLAKESPAGEASSADDLTETATLLQDQIPTPPRYTVTVPPPDPARAKRRQAARNYRRMRWGLGLAAAAVFLLILYPSVLQPAWQNFQLNRELTSLCSAEAVRCEDIAAEDSSRMATIAQRADNSLLVILERRPPAGQVYQAWEIIDGSPQSLGTWSNRVMRISQLEAASVFGITLEPPGGSPQPTSTPIVVFALDG